LRSATQDHFEGAHNVIRLVLEKCDYKFYNMRKDQMSAAG